MAYLSEFSRAGAGEAAASAAVRLRGLFVGAVDPGGLLAVLRLRLLRTVPWFDSIHADMAAELALISSGMTTPFSRAIFSANDICAGLAGLEPRLSSRFTASFLGRVPVEECAADGSRLRVAGRRLDALLPGDAVGKALHRRRRWTISGAAVDRGAEQGRSCGSGAFLELADDALGDIAHGINRADHLLLADNDIVEQAFKLRRYSRVD